ncbi:MAG: DUF4831 family protein [Bacteroidales bacterium]|nr:DUF4831 family protein [Bacteroidales bacterium]
MTYSRKSFTRMALLLILAFTVSSCTHYKVFSVKESPAMPISGGTLYALPRTQIVVSVAVERRDLSSAPYSDYAADFLGVDASALDTAFHISSIDVAPLCVADPDRFFYIRVRRGSVSVDQRHLLLAIGMDPLSSSVAPADDKVASSYQTSSFDAEYNLVDRTDTVYSRYDTPGRPTMTLQRKDVRSLRQRAADVASRIDDIQTRQQDLLESDASYSAEALSIVMNQLKKQESDLVASFCGDVKREVVRFYVDPSPKRNASSCDTVVWFSPSVGFCGDVETIPEDAFPIICTVQSDNLMNKANRFVRYHTAGITVDSHTGRTGNAAKRSSRRHGFRYRVPEPASVEVTCPFFTVRRTLPVVQLGPIMELPRHRIKAQFDPETLQLLNLSR